MNSSLQNLAETGLLSPSKSTLAVVLESQSMGAAVLPKPGRAAIRPLPKLDKSRSRLSGRDPATGKPWFVEALRSRWKVYRERLEVYREEPSSESVHQLRVATRRLVSQLILLGCIFPGRKAHKARRMLKRQLQSLGALRDLHIQRIFIDQQAPRFPELAVLQYDLHRQEHQFIKPLSRQVSASKMKKMEKWIDGLTRDLTHASSNSSAREKLTTVALHCAEEAFAETVRRRRSIALSDLRTIHRTRVAFKKFRYIVECLPLSITGLSKRELRRLAYYQRRMGIIQDLEVIQAGVIEFIQENQDLQNLLHPFCTYLRRRLARALRSFRKSADRLFQFWPPPRLSETSPSHSTCYAA
jgi:CHAD domain-containing protein